VSVILRLARYGKKKAPFYRIVATEKQSKRDGKFIDIVGHFNPMTNPSTVVLKEDKVKKWIEVGAKSSLIVENLIKKTIPGLIEAKTEHRKKKIQEARRKRKERAKARAEK
jgi:small subunit ribosomal protein S16